MLPLPSLLSRWSAETGRNRLVLQIPSKRLPFPVGFVPTPVFSGQLLTMRPSDSLSPNARGLPSASNLTDAFAV